MGGMPGRAVRVAANLGVGTRMGRARNQGAGIRAGRLAKIRARLGKFRRLRRAGAQGVPNIFRAGVRPQAFFGAEVGGASDAELLAYRRAALSLRAASARTCSLTAKILRLGDPAGLLPFAATLIKLLLVGMAMLISKTCTT